MKNVEEREPVFVAVQLLRQVRTQFASRPECAEGVAELDSVISWLEDGRHPRKVTFSDSVNVARILLDIYRMLRSQSND
jgi:hypothetical protein